MNEGHSAFLAHRAHSPPDAEVRAELRRGARTGFSEPRVHHPHAGRGRPRLLLGRTDGPLLRRLPARRWACVATNSSPSDARDPRQSGRAVLHDHPGDETRRRSATASANCTRESAARCGMCCGPECRENEVPITDITNGVHFRSWISAEMNQLYDRYLGPNWREEPADCTLVAPRRFDPGAGIVGHARAAPRAAGVLCAAAAGVAAAAPRCAAVRGRGGRGGARPAGPDHRLRAPLCDLQARHPAAARSRRGWPAS